MTHSHESAVYEFIITIQFGRARHRLFIFLPHIIFYIGLIKYVNGMNDVGAASDFEERTIPIFGILLGLWWSPLQRWVGRLPVDDERRLALPGGGRAVSRMTFSFLEAEVGPPRRVQWYFVVEYSCFLISA